MRYFYLLCVAIFVSGCSSKGLYEFKEPKMEEGCYASNVEARLGYLNQEGEAEACKVKCSPKLPEGYCWEYTNQQAGCKAKVGDCG